MGQCTLHWGRMEYGNLGNYAIVEPFVRELHRVFPEAEIYTTFQMSDDFCTREQVKRLSMELYYGWKRSDLWKSVYEVMSAWILKHIRVRSPKTAYMKEIIASDLIIDFSGDIWGENASLVGKHRFFIGILKDLTAHWLAKPIVLLAGSPGPFETKWGRMLAAIMLKRFDLVTNRESISVELMKRDHLPVHSIHSLACPAFLFEAYSDDDMQDIYVKENLIDDSKPTVGFILCGWNMPIGPFNRSPRDHSEFRVFAETVEFIENELGARVCLLSHNNGFTKPPDFKITEGRDHEIVQQLKKVLDDREKTKNVFILKGLYDCGQTKAIIRQFDMLVSGRIHGAVSALSQIVPTVIIDYGHEPKAHKLRGFAAVAEMSEYVADPGDSADVIQKVQQCWSKRASIREHLNERIPEVQELARENFNLLPGVLHKETSTVNGIRGK
ncbi:MAG: hypothetical protein BA863_08335 [Desulfovibrio sp. S3730MH75]|nr:MAG: hypothetical protein BA863_08335 [Desulfovibrio sp. S3730MH75]